MKLLISKEADLKRVDKNGNSTLHVRAMGGAVEVLEFFLNKGANVDEVNEYDQTPLQFAAEHGNLGATKLLLSRGADPNKVSMETMLFMLQEWEKLRCSNIC